MLPTGSTLLNLQLSNQYNGGLLQGTITNIIGDSSAGKSFLALTMLAEASHNKAFDNYTLYYDDAECANNFNIKELFGNLSKRITSPYKDKGGSDCLESFYFNLDSILDKNEPFIYILDSMDALTTLSEDDKFDDNKKAFNKGNKIKGSYGDGKAKINSECLRKIHDKIEKTNSYLIIVSQTRDNITDQFIAKTRSGGHAIKFYSTYEMWMSVGSKIMKPINDIDRHIGNNVKVKVSKNKATGCVGILEFPVNYIFGIDDADSMIGYLLKEKHFKMSGAYIDNNGIFDKKMYRKEMVIEAYKGKNLDLLGKECQKVWDNVQAQIREGQTGRYK